MADLSLDAVRKEKRAIEDVDRAFREVDQLLEAWENRLTLDNRRFVDRYLEGLFRLHVHATGRNGADYCAVFERAFVDRPGTNTLRSRHPWKAQHRNRHRKVHSVLFYNCREEQAVFIADVQLVKNPVAVCPSFVWLQRLDEAHRMLTRSLVFGTKTGFHTVGVLDDRKARVVSDLRFVLFDERDIQVVERRPKVVNDIANDGGEFFRQVVMKMEDVVDPPAIRVYLSSDRVGVEIAPPLDEILTLDEVLLGPFGLDPRAGKWIVQGVNPCVP